LHSNNKIVINNMKYKNSVIKKNILIGMLISINSILVAQNEVLTKVDGGATWLIGSGGIYSGDGTAPSDVDVTVTDNIDFDAGTLFIDGTNNEIGIGTSNPISLLEIQSSTIAGNTSTITLSNHSGDVLAQDIIGGIAFRSNDVSGSGTGGVAYVTAEAATAFLNTTTGRPTNLKFHTAGVGANSPESRLILDHSGRLGINTGGVNLSEIFTVISTAGTQGTYESIGWVHLSDQRLKENIKPILNPLDLVTRLNGVYFDWKADKSVGRQMGFIAQDVKEVLPEVVSGFEGDIEKGETLGMAYQNLVPLLVEAVKELEKQNKLLMDRLTVLESKTKTNNGFKK